jgi:hypothetical protein
MAAGDAAMRASTTVSRALLALVIAVLPRAVQAVCPPDGGTQCEEDEDCDGIPDDKDPCPAQCDHAQCPAAQPNNEPAECSTSQACSDGMQCTEAGRCADAAPQCADTSLAYGDGTCVEERDADGIPNSCQEEPRPGWTRPGYCWRYGGPVGFLGLFGTPYALAYLQRDGHNELTYGLEVFVAGRLGRYRFERGATVAPRWSYTAGLFGNGFTDDQGHVGARVALRYRVVAAGWLRASLALQYVVGEAQVDATRSQFAGLVVGADLLSAVSIGVLVQTDVNHSRDPGVGGLLRLDLSDLAELGLPISLP